MKICLIGYGHLGKIHFKCLKETAFSLVGIYDPAYIGKSPVDGVRFFDNMKELLSLSEACIIAAPTVEHYLLASQAMAVGLHCFIEKPIAATIYEAELLVEQAKANSHLITQIGFVERYNPAYTFLVPEIKDPKFIEVHRLATFNNRGNDVSVVFDLMIHDLDLLVNIKNTPIVDVKATGVKVFTDTLDICNARIEFEDGAVANLTASRMSLKVMRKFRIFQENSYLSMDLQKKESQVINLSDLELENSMEIKVGENSKHLLLKSSGVLEGNAIVEELKDFYQCIIKRSQSNANILSAMRTTRLAQKIEAIANVVTNRI